MAITSATFDVHLTSILATVVAWWPTFSEPRLALSDGTLDNLKVMIVIVRLALE